MKKILFVCMGNICRSPAADGIMKSLLTKSKLTDVADVDSAGTIGYHEGELPDKRMQKAGAERGYLFNHVARKIKKSDLDSFDMIFVMDDNNFNEVKKLSTVENIAKIEKITDYCRTMDASEVPDPYYGGEQGFHYVISLLEDACSTIINEKL